MRAFGNGRSDIGFETSGAGSVVSSIGRAPVCETGCNRFESCTATAPKGQRAANPQDPKQVPSGPKEAGVCLNRQLSWPHRQRRRPPAPARAGAKEAAACDAKAATPEGRHAACGYRCREAGPTRCRMLRGSHGQRSPHPIVNGRPAPAAQATLRVHKAWQRKHPPPDGSLCRHRDMDARGFRPRSDAGYWKGVASCLGSRP